MAEFNGPSGVTMAVGANCKGSAAETSVAATSPSFCLLQFLPMRNVTTTTERQNWRHLAKVRLRQK